MLNRRAFLGSLLASGSCPLLLAAESPSIDSRELFTPETEAAIGRALDWLTARQQPAGYFGSANAFNPYLGNPAVNALCGMALLSAGSTPGRGPYGTAIERCIDYIVTCAAPTGFIAEPDTSYYEAAMYGHGFATTFLAEVYGMTERQNVRDLLHRAVQLIVGTQNREGGWRYAPEPKDADVSVTVCQMMALRAAHNTGVSVPRETIDRGVQYILRCQNPDGGFRYQALAGGESQFPRSAAAIVALYTSGMHEGAPITAGLQYLRQFRPGQPGIRDRGYYFYAHYYAMQAAWHAGGDEWTAWYAAARDEMLRLQLSSGQWSDPSVGPEYATAMSLIALQLPNNYLPIFQR
ncbi:MAG: prenyltransferase/squalene oxidase repeat-containing protein [Planctomycetaceae bacterium]